MTKKVGRPKKSDSELRRYWRRQNEKRKKRKKKGKN